ncbi:hypothetical protein RISK_002258 [Rhodopirellula islandica]|uniref:Uncharacterized protein n=1 Tax=Rhodopirellula islandica TaxID=595434 RepID=A0A0J1BGG3_RHOIS|nr:hypothetical protein RISK_002258 [Rhodopirellula islandica]
MGGGLEMGDYTPKRAAHQFGKPVSMPSFLLVTPPTKSAG